MLAEADLQQALDHDAAQKAQPKLPANPLEARLLELRAELAGFAELSPELKQNKNMHAEVWPKIGEYCAGFINLAVQRAIMTCAADLGIKPEEVLASAAAKP